MDWLLGILGLLLAIVGIIGCIIPLIPGPAIAWCAVLCASFVSSATLSYSTLCTYLVITVAVSIADYFLPAYMTRLAGGSKAGIRGATAGLIVGLLIGNIIGAIVGPFIGAFAGEYINDSSDLKRAFRVSLGSMLSFVVGTGLKLAATLAMFVCVWRVVWQMASELFS